MKNKLNTEEMIVAFISIGLVLALVYLVWVVIVWVLIYSFGWNINIWKLGLGLLTISVATKLILPKSQ